MEMFRALKKAAAEKDIEALMSLYHEDFEFIRHQSGTTLKKPEYRELMDKNIEMPLSLDNVANQCSVSTRQLLRLFKTHVGTSPQQQYLALRLDKSVSLLQQTNLTMTEIAIATGFANLSYFSIAFSKRALISPSQYRKTYKK